MAVRDVRMLRESAGEGAGRRAGAQLQRARERRGLSATDVAAGLHLDLRTVSALERDAWDELPPATFTRGYYRAYARFMELPEESVLEALDGDGLEGERRPLQPRVGALAGARRGSWFPAAMLVLLAVGVIGSTLWYRQQLESYEAEAEGGQVVAGQTASAPSGAGAGDSPGLPAGASDTPATAAPEAAAAPSPEPVPPSAGAPGAGDPLPSAAARTAADPVQSPPPAAAAEVDPRTPAPSAAAQAPTPDAGDRSTAEPGPGGSGSEPTEVGESPATATAPVASDTAPAASGDDREPAAAQSSPIAAEPVGSAPLATQALELRLAGPSWVEVVDARGQRLIYGLLSGGSRRTVSGVPPISVVIGDAAVAELRYQGDELALQDHTRGKVARLMLGQERPQ